MASFDYSPEQFKMIYCTECGNTSYIAEKMVYLEQRYNNSIQIASKKDVLRCVKCNSLFELEENKLKKISIL